MYKTIVVITVLESRWEWNEISIEFELRWKTVSEAGPWVLTRTSSVHNWEQTSDQGWGSIKQFRYEMAVLEFSPFFKII